MYSSVVIFSLAYILPILNGLRTVTNANSVFALIVAPVQNLVVQIYQVCIYFLFDIFKLKTDLNLRSF
jgi:superfamily II DNA/RNA helicase